jgi:HEAT repeat protein
MFKIRCFILSAAVAIAALISLATHSAQAAEPEAAEDLQQPWIEVLKSDASKADKAMACKRLNVYGDGQAVPFLAPLLQDAELSSWARIALEAIPDPAADEALRNAMDLTSGRLLIGVINSIGVREDAQAVEGLAKRLSATDAEVASAAAAALGRIGSAAAIEALKPALTGTSAAVRNAAAEGCILSAEKLLAAGDADQAAALYDAVRAAEVPKMRIVEATRGAILARGAAGVPLLIEQLQSDDRALFHIGLTTARELSGRAVTDALMAEMGRTTSDRQALLLLVLADRGDTEALPAIMQAAQAGPARARIAAIGVLKRLGNASCVPSLLEIAADADAEVAQAAREALEGLPGDDVNADLAARLAKAQGAARLPLIEAIGLRRVDALPPLLAAIDDPDPAVRQAVLAALGSVIDLERLPVLIERAIEPKHAEDAVAAGLALRAASIRMPDREACAAKLAAAMPRASLAAKVAILEVLTAMGGDRALQTVGAAAKASEDELKDAGSRLLGEWMTVDAAPVLLDLAKTATEEKYEIRAIRGYLRIVRQFDVPLEERAAMCRSALQAARRDAEKKLVLEVLQRYPSIDMLRLAVEIAKVPALKNDAAATALAIAQKISGSADVQQLLTQVGQQPVKVEIVKAEYGTDSKAVDVTETLRRNVRDFPLIVLPSSSYNSAFGGDPVPGVVKRLKVQYRMDGRAGEAAFAEDATILLPVPR